MIVIAVMVLTVGGVLGFMLDDRVCVPIGNLRVFPNTTTYGNPTGVTPPIIRWVLETYAPG